MAQGVKAVCNTVIPIGADHPKQYSSIIYQQATTIPGQQKHVAEIAYISEDGNDGFRTILSTRLHERKHIKHKGDLLTCITVLSVLITTYCTG